ncbi:MAG: YggT family protein [Coriobacteriales bacterium]|jgi:YggT family protein|nr:YggT family protein [Coriobacteriales bacterium]
MIRNIISTLGSLYTLLVFVWALFSWFDHSKGVLNDIYKALDTLCGPYVGLFRRFIPPLSGIDLSPLIAIVVLQVVVQLLVRIL